MIMIIIMIMMIIIIQYDNQMSVSHHKIFKDIFDISCKSPVKCLAKV